MRYEYGKIARKTSVIRRFESSGHYFAAPPPRLPRDCFVGPHSGRVRNHDCGGAELLAQACQALDRAEGLAAAIARDGDVVRSRGGVFKTHPAVREELACRSFVVRTLERLGVTSESVKRPGRPPSGGVGWQPDDDEP